MSDRTSVTISEASTKFVDHYSKSRDIPTRGEAVDKLLSIAESRLRATGNYAKKEKPAKSKKAPKAKAAKPSKPAAEKKPAAIKKLAKPTGHLKPGNRARVVAPPVAVPASEPAATEAVS